MLISVHGPIHGNNLGLGQDAETGGQTKSVVVLVQALDHYPRVGKVDRITPQAIHQRVSADDAEPLEQLIPKVSIVRLPCGSRRYLSKEVLWPYLDGLIDNILHHLRSMGVIPDVVHSHSMAAGYGGARLTQLLDVPLIFT